MSVASAVAKLAFPCHLPSAEAAGCVTGPHPQLGCTLELGVTLVSFQGQCGLPFLGRNVPPPRAAQQLLLQIPGMFPPGQLLGPDSEALLGLAASDKPGPGSQGVGEKVMAVCRAGCHGRLPSLRGTSAQTDDDLISFSRLCSPSPASEDCSWEVLLLLPI